MINIITIVREGLVLAVMACLIVGIIIAIYAVLPKVRQLFKRLSRLARSKVRKQSPLKLPPPKRE